MASMSAGRFPIGESSYHDGSRTSPFRKMQYVCNARLAMQLRSAAVEFDRDVLKNNGEHLTPNEGVRELERQIELYNNHQNNPGRWALAAVPGYSTHDPKIGTAVDFGITRADGTNRALTYAEFQALYKILERRGIVHTGALFRIPEAWHCNGGYAELLEPITDAPLMGEDYHPSIATPDQEDEDMLRFHRATNGGDITAFIGARSCILKQFKIGSTTFTPENQADLLRELYAVKPTSALTSTSLKRQALQKIMRGMK